MTTSLFTDPVASFLDARDGGIGHMSVWGVSGTGKTQLFIGICRHRLRDPAWSVQVVDVEGDITLAGVEFVANPANRVPPRTIHVLRPASATDTFALPILSVDTPDPFHCCQVSVRALSIFQQAVGFGLDEYGPRLSKLFLLGTYGLALTGRPLIDLPDLFSRNSEQLRAVIGDSFPYQFLSDELRALDVLQERQFLEYRDALISRLMPIFSNPRLRRLFGPQRPALDLKTILRQRESVFLDLSGLAGR